MPRKTSDLPRVTQLKVTILRLTPNPFGLSQVRSPHPNSVFLWAADNTLPFEYLLGTFQGKKSFSFHYWRDLWNASKQTRFFKLLLSRLTEAFYFFSCLFWFPPYIFFSAWISKDFFLLVSANRSRLFCSFFSLEVHLSVSLSVKPSLGTKYWRKVTWLLTETG